ncbi:outer membrane protein [Rubellimicrobium aerolatum]|uniref:Outer membrane protein n=1 Tax=Rubellimicrobium aerolatum TaxID=490979 RepID=A0ABW0SCU7_9RHOB|nr:outer membrane beta-barrel protein [Rubellimicrobium aerolatum]MBP1806158.1 lipid A oxidase [Rubellimicrobium aerolatum]
MTHARLLAPLALLLATPALAEVELSFYGGWQSAPHSGVTIDGGPAGVDDDFTAGWEGRSFEAPIHAGLRATWWTDADIGFGLDVNHVKAYADDGTLAESGLEHFEFSDGLNVATVNGYRRWPGAFGRLTPYVGGGIGVAVPHVEVEDDDTGARTWGYQLTGPAVAWIAGATLPLTDRWAVFGEYKGTYSQNEADLDDGGTLSTDIVTNALNVGVSFSF